MMPFEGLLAAYDFRFPESAIAQEPASPRDAARLLIYDRATKKASFDVFSRIGDHLPKGAVLVMNDTKVLPARLWVRKPTGGKAAIIYLDQARGLMKVMADRKLNPGSVLRLTPKLSFRVVRQEEKFYYLRPSFPMSRLFAVLERYGHTPIPPYIKHSPLDEAKLREKYQTVFARVRGSVAAPTASLHFTKRLLRTLKKRGIRIAFVTLHVNIGTFAPLTEDQARSGKLHEEWYVIDRKTIAELEKAKKSGCPVIAVGTTAVRTLESAADASGKLKRLTGTTDLFIREGYRFRFVDGLITNFHVPKSSLLMLVAALTGRAKLLELYRKAIRKGFKLFSFGDGMLVR
ncbi:MAG: tRNA preQ1(34) S-adenosylmethionine ribosyltransferase-isomerase QueA [Patescibacteria group bacterium]|nr:tRNA preQ1(34) S-adenosylmethionine ribosyltransferase-isomerase QueA [Patescibacteria group bacterium]